MTSSNGNSTNVPPSSNNASAAGRRALPILAPTTSQLFPDLQYSVHVPPRSMRRDILPVFPDAKLSLISPLLVIPTFQKASVPLVEYGPQQQSEKDRLLLRFFHWCDKVIQRLAILQPTAWVDATDPASGTAWKGTAASCYSDVDGIIRLLPYPTMDAGGCRIVSHPLWKFAVYPATLFTTASPHVVTQALFEVNQMPLDDCHTPDTSCPFPVPCLNDESNIHLSANTHTK